MTMIKKLPLTMAVIAAFFPLTSVMAQEFTQEQIDAIVAKAVDKALADRQAKIDAAADKKVDVITNPQTTAASPDMAIPRPATRNMSASTAPITAPRRSAVSATKATAANSRSARPSKARRGLSGILT